MFFLFVFSKALKKHWQCIFRVVQWVKMSSSSNNIACLANATKFISKNILKKFGIYWDFFFQDKFKDWLKPNICFLNGSFSYFNQKKLKIIWQTIWDQGKKSFKIAPIYVIINTNLTLLNWICDCFRANVWPSSFVDGVVAVGAKRDVYRIWDLLMLLKQRV